MEHKPTVFVSSDYRYVCDTCEPLKRGISRGEIAWVGFRRGLYPGCEFASEELDGVRLCAYWDSRRRQTWKLPYHRNEGLEIGFVSRGSAEFSADRQSGKYDVLTPECVAVTKPWQEHSVGNPFLGACKMFFLIIDFGVRRPNQDWEWPSWISLGRADRFEFSRRMQNMKASIFKSNPEMRGVFARIGKILDLGSPESRVSELTVLFNRLLLELLNAFRGEQAEYSQSAPNESVVRCFLEQLEAHCAAPWTLEDMAEDCGLKPTRFTYYCRVLANATPMELLNAARLERARKILDEGGGRENLSMTELALSCGFSSSQYFSTKFRQKFGVSPRDYRARSAPDAPRAGKVRS